MRGESRGLGPRTSSDAATKLRAARSGMHARAIRSSLQLSYSRTYELYGFSGW